MVGRAPPREAPLFPGLYLFSESCGPPLKSSARSEGSAYASESPPPRGPGMLCPLPVLLLVPASLASPTGPRVSSGKWSH